MVDNPLIRCFFVFLAAGFLHSLSSQNCDAAEDATMLWSQER